MNKSKQLIKMNESNWNEIKNKLEKDTIYLNEWRNINYKVFDDLLKFEIIYNNDESHSGKIIIKSINKPYIFNEWSSSLNRICTKVINKLYEIKPYEFNKPLMRLFLNEWVNKEYDKEIKSKEVLQNE